MEILHTWSRDSSGGLCVENMATLPLLGKALNLYCDWSMFSPRKSWTWDRKGGWNSLVIMYNWISFRLNKFSRKSYGRFLVIQANYVPILYNLRGTGAILNIDSQEALLAHFHVRLALVDWVRETQNNDHLCTRLRVEARSEARNDLRVRKDVILMMGNKLLFLKKMRS